MTYLLWFFAICYCFWLHFLIFSAYKAALDAGRAVPLIAKALIFPVILAGVAIDVAFNVTLGALMFMEHPGARFAWNSPTSWTFTSRCDFYLGATAWRGALARWLCKNLLDPFQSGGHCKGA